MLSAEGLSFEVSEPVHRLSAARISVALATFNGEQYLEQQLESIVAQHAQPVEVVVGDDGSTDGTLEVLENFKRTAPFPVKIYKNQRTLGYADNFLSTATRCSGEWIAFCDQDDVWLQSKLQDVQRALAFAKNDLVLVHQTAWIGDAELATENRIFPRPVRPRRHGPNEHYGFWVWIGMCQTVRADVITKFDWKVRPLGYFPGDPVMSHCKWICMLANALGGIAYLPRPSAIYRRHERALTGWYACQSPNERLAKARRTGAEHYRYLCGVAAESAECLRKHATLCANPAWAEKLAASANLFDNLATLQSRRAELYSSQSTRDRVRHYLAMWRGGAYTGKKFYRVGALSAGKDLARVLS